MKKGNQCNDRNQRTSLDCVIVMGSWAGGWDLIWIWGSLDFHLKKGKGGHTYVLRRL